MMKICMVLLFLFLGIISTDAQILQKNTSRKAEKGLFGRSHSHKKEVKIRQSRSVQKAIKKQEAKLKKQESDYDKSVVWSKKRTVDIQTPEVQARMKQNKKETARRDKEKKKKVKSSTKKAAKKYL